MRILTFDIGGTNIKYALCNEKFVLTDRHTIPTEAEKGGQELIIKIISIIEEYENIDRVAVSTAGQVDSAAALGEAKFGAGKGKSDFLCLSYGTGIGGALYLNNKLYKGMGSSAGEFGHMITHAGGKQCTCGGEGCYECYASTKALLESVNKRNSTNLNAFEIFEKENFTKPEIRSVIDQWIDEMIIGLINIIYIFNPPLIILGGGIMNEDYVIDLIDRKIYNLLMENFKDVNIVRSKLGNDAPLLGVAAEASKLRN